LNSKLKKKICGVKTTFIQKKKNRKKLNPCHQIIFLGSKYAKIAFAAGALPRTTLGELERSPEPLAGFGALLLLVK